MFDIQLCLCSAFITIVQKSSAYGYGYYSYKALSLVQRAVAMLVQCFPVLLKYFPTVYCIRSFKSK